MDKAQKTPSMLDELRGIMNTKTIPLLMGSLIIPLAAFMLYPFLTIYFTHDLGFSAALAGILLSLRFLSSALLGFLGGWLSDRVGLVATYVAASTVTAVAVFLLAYQRQMLPLVVLLVVLGVSASTVNASVRGLANQYVTEGNRGTVQNYIHWLNNLGMAAALPISAFALHAGHSRLPFIVTAAAYFVMALVLGRAFGMRSGKVAESGSPETKPKSVVFPWGILRDDRAFAYLMASLVFWCLVEMQFESNIPLDLSYHFPHGAELYGSLGVIDMVIVFVLQLIVSHWLAQQKSPWFGYLGFVMLGGVIIGGLWQSIAGWTLSIVFLSVGEVFSISQIMAMMGVLPQAGRQGSYFALFGMAQGLATFLAYGLGGSAYQLLHAGWLFSLCLPVAILSALCYRQARVWHARQSPANEAESA